MGEKTTVINEKQKSSGTQEPAQAPVVPVKGKFAKLAEEPVRYKESRVRLEKFKFPNAPGNYSTRGGLPRNAKDPDGNLLLEDVPSVSGKKTQKVHRLVAKRLQAMNEKWVQDTGNEALLVSSGWRLPKWDNFRQYHDWCVQRSYWLTREEHGPGPAVLTDSYPDPQRRPNRRPTSKAKKRGKCTLAKAFNSPHEAGLAVDFGNNGFTGKLDLNKDVDEKTEAFGWLKENAHLFGFTPYLTEGWHWEVNMPLESWITGEEWVEDENYAVRIKGPGRTGKSTGAFSQKRTGGPCPWKGLIGGNQGTQDLEQLGRTTPELEGVLAGARFPDEASRGKRDLAEIHGFIIHETGGGFGFVPTAGEGGKDPRCFKTILKKGGSIHFTVDRNGVIRQHFPFEMIAKASGRAHDLKTLCAELPNYAGDYMGTDNKRKWVNKESKSETDYPVLDRGFMRKGHLLNTPAQSEGLWRLLQKLKAKLPNFQLTFPAAEQGGAFSFTKMPASVTNTPGVVPHHKFSTHNDGHFTEYFCLCRSRGFSKMDAWWMSVGAAAKAGEGEIVPMPSSGNKQSLIEFGKAKLRETREKYKKEKSNTAS